VEIAQHHLFHASEWIVARRALVDAHTERRGHRGDLAGYTDVDLADLGYCANLADVERTELADSGGRAESDPVEGLALDATRQREKG